MRLKGERDFKADELYTLLSDEVVNEFGEYIKTIKDASLEDMNNNDKLVELIEESQPVQYCTFVGLLNANFDLHTLDVLVDIESKHHNLIKVLSTRLNGLKSTINIFNEEVVEAFIQNSVYLLVSYYELEEAE